MNPELALEMIRAAFPIGIDVPVPLLIGGRFFTATRINEIHRREERNGIRVSNLGNNSFLSWNVFSTTINLLTELGGQATKGNAHGQGITLGHELLSTDSIEGRVASVVYNMQIGQIVFQRITPIVGILIHAGICQNIPNGLEFLPEFQHQ